MKQIIRINQTTLKEMIEHIIKESSVAARGTSIYTHDYPNDPQYYNDYGTVDNADTDTYENTSIEKYGTAIAKRIENALKKHGFDNARVEVHEDTSTHQQEYGSYDEFVTRKMFFEISFDILSRKDRVMQSGSREFFNACALVGKMFESLSMVKSFELTPEYNSRIQRRFIRVSAVVEPDKNGVEVLDKSRSYYTNDNNELEEAVTRAIRKYLH